MLRSEVLAGPSLFDRLKSPWSDLVGRSPTASPFQTWEWQSVWYRNYGLAKEPRAFCLWEGQDLVGLMSFVKTAGPWRVLRPLGIGPSDYLHPLAATGYSEIVAREVAQYLAGVGDIDLIDLHQLREAEALAQEIRFDRNIEQARCLVLDLPAGYETYLANLGKSLRYDVKRLDKELFRSGRAKIERVSADSLPSGFSSFLLLHKARWHKRRLPGAFVGRSESFHREWVALAEERGWLRLSLLQVEGDLIGAIYAMSLGSTAYYYQAGLDPHRSALSPGTLLVADTIRNAIEEGRTQFDFMRGDEPYKRRWKPQHLWKNRRIMAIRNPALGRPGLAWNEFASGIEDRVRAKLEGRGVAAAQDRQKEG